VREVNIPRNADQDVKKMISGIYQRIDKAGDAEGRRFESEPSSSSS